MAAKIALCFITAFLVFLAVNSNASLIKREITETKPTTTSAQTVDEALQSFKNGLDDLIKNIQSNELYQNVSQSLKNFGAEVEAQSKKLVEKIQTASKTETTN